MLAHSIGSISVEGFSAEDYQLFTRKILAKLGIRLGEYKTDQMQRRLTTLAKQYHITSFSDYFIEMQKNSAMLKEFLDQMTINVTELMRNPELFTDLSTQIFPDLVKQSKGSPLSVWSAGCSYGAEAYTVAMLLSEINPTPPFRIYGTDLDLAVLAKANSMTFSANDMVSVSSERRKRHFIEIDEDTFMPMPALRRTISFSQQDLLSEDYPSNSYDLILCRNVVIYFNDEAKKRIFANFWKALRPNGVLFVGGTERLGDSRSLNFQLIRPFFYRAINKG